MSGWLLSGQMVFEPVPMSVRLPSLPFALNVRLTSLPVARGESLASLHIARGESLVFLLLEMNARSVPLPAASLYLSVLTLSFFQNLSIGLNKYDQAKQ